MKNSLAGDQMQQRVEHEFEPEDNRAFLALSGGLYRFSVMTGVLGMALIALGITAVVTGAYHEAVAGPAIILLGLVAMVGGTFFMRPRATFHRIADTRGSDVTKLLDALSFLDAAHGVFRLLIVAFVVARLGSFLLARLT
jgi:hypothetical protein